METLSKLNKFSANRQFKRGILFARAALKITKDKSLKAKLLEKLGRWHDQHALSRKSTKQRTISQNKALYYFRKLRTYDRFEALRGIGAVYHHRYKPEKAVLYYRKARRLKPRNYTILNDLGNAYQRFGTMRDNPSFLQRAEDYYRQSIRAVSSPELKIHPLINLALLSQRMGKRKDAKRYASQALEVSAKNSHVIVPKRLTALLKEMRRKQRSLGS